MLAKLKLQHPKQTLIYQIHDPGHTKTSPAYSMPSDRCTERIAPRNSTKVHRHHPLSTTRLEGWPQGVTDEVGLMEPGVLRSF